MPRDGDSEARAGAQPPALCHCPKDGAPPRYVKRLAPHRSLGANAQRKVVWFAVAGLALPILPLMLQGAASLVLLFAGLTLAALAIAFARNMRDARLCEIVRLWPDCLSVTRYEPDGTQRHWCAKPQELRLHISPDGPPENYLTLAGNNRRIELGAYLTPEERLALYEELDEALRFAAVSR
ncbi:DUF2244 domain-containing protein [Abyssibius alkaniclasticus]|uniref:DUF2244 domain-containing protein n=1 Tax=Abyssibius alkaniclasticus TaxID=2881234 RepID=UPI0023636479|nr:DUF2244 domain-containing protein [Abyssibius alkaniclasticus]UPH70766.1 DUF2244 domain-containing protein [Abyssibius alkaniclasticus]